MGSGSPKWPPNMYISSIVNKLWEGEQKGAV